MSSSFEERIIQNEEVTEEDNFTNDTLSKKKIRGFY